MEISGKIKWIDEIRTYGSNGFRKKELVITTQEQYPQNILIEFTQEKCELLDKYEIDDNIKIGINIRGREWINPEGQTKYFNSIQGWRIEKIEIPDIENKPESFTTNTESPSQDVNEEEDDLPF
ncbi:MAG: DUF3127 domain-containing protein [Flavobacteriaceae bacterium TMED220]|nr:MAG: DUF3127 domain-containing protein [Flavobacteriaceae bacterium TMED220]